MFKAHGQALGCLKCPQRRIWEHVSDWLNSFVTEEKKQKKRLDSRSTRLRFERFNEPTVIHFVHRLARCI